MRSSLTAKNGFTLLEVSIALLIISILVSAITIWAMQLRDRYEEQKLLLGHRQLVNTLMSEFLNVQTGNTVQITDSNMPKFLQDHSQVNAPYQIRDKTSGKKICIKQSPKSVLVNLNLGNNGATVNSNGRNFSVAYRALPKVLCYRLYMQELDLYCGQNDDLNTMLTFSVVVNGNVVNSCTNYKTQPDKSGCTDVSFTYAVPLQ